MPAPEEPNVLDYAPPAPPLQRRDSIEYYREPPVMAEWGLAHLIGWVVGFVVVGLLMLYAIGKWFNRG